MKKLIALIALISISGLALAEHGGRGFGRSYRGGGFRDGYRGDRGAYFVGAYAPGIAYEDPYNYGPAVYEEPYYGPVEATAEDVAETGLESAEDVTEDTARTIRNIL